MSSNDHRAELLDRAYRRGYALRRRRRGTAAIVGLAVVCIVVGGAVSLSGRRADQTLSVVPPSTTTAPPPCPTSIAPVPAAEVPADVEAWAGGAPVIGEGGLWTIVSATHVAATLDNQTLGKQTYALKFPWYTKPNGLPTISGRRLDGPGTFHSSVDRAFDARGAFDVSTLEFSAPGCWEVTGRFQSSTLQFRARVGPAPSSVVFADENDGLGLNVKCNVPPNADPVCDFDILSSSDAGRTWIRVGGVHGIKYAGWRGYPDIQLAASGSSVWVYGTRTFASHDGGQTFRDEHFDGLVSALVPKADNVWIASRACAQCPTETLLSSPISGGPWEKIGNFPNLDDPYADIVRPTATVAYVVGLDTHAVLYRTDDAGRSWQSHALPPVPPASPRTATVTLAALGSDQVWMLNGGSAPGRNQQKALYRSDDGARHWALVADTAAQRPGVGHLPRRGLGLNLTVVTPQQMWMPIDRGPFTGTRDGGQHWLDSGISTAVAQVFFVDPLHGWAWNADTSYRTTDGQHWTPITG